MTDQQKFKTYCSWIAIDIAKDFNVVMLETADGQTRRFKMANSGKDQLVICWLTKSRKESRCGHEFDSVGKDEWLGSLCLHQRCA